MKVYRAYKVELDPNNKQRTLLLRNAGAARFTWNWALARRIEEYEATGNALSAYSLGKELVALKKIEFAWMRELSSHAVGIPLDDARILLDNHIRGIAPIGKFQQLSSWRCFSEAYKVRLRVWMNQSPSFNWILGRDRIQARSR